MSLDYTVDLTIGPWSTSLTRGQLVNPAADALVLDGLRASWDMEIENYPCQPNPTTVSFGLFVPVKATGPTPEQGQAVVITLTLAGSGNEARPLFEFYGRVSDLDASPRRTGLAYSFTCVEHTASLGEERLGDTPWPSEFSAERLDRIIDASSLPLLFAPDERQWWIGLTHMIAARDVDSQPTGDLLEDTFVLSYMFRGPLWWWSGYAASVRAPGAGETLWVRPIIAVTRVPSTQGHPWQLQVLLVTNGAPSTGRSLPYQLQLVGASWRLVRKLAEPVDSQAVAWIPAAAVHRDVTWRQDKAANTNRVTVKTTNGFVFDRPIDFEPLGGALTVQYDDQVDTYGPVEKTVQIAPALDHDAAPYNLAVGLLGTHYDATPHYTLDRFDVLPEQIADPDAWPRLFAFADHYELFDTHVGRLVYVTDIPDEWNLHPRGDYFGRLVGAELRVDAGEVTMSATLLHRLPAAAGMTEPDIARQLDGNPPPAHTPLRWSQLATAGTGNPTWADLAQVYDDTTDPPMLYQPRWADFALIDSTDNPA